MKEIWSNHCFDLSPSFLGQFFDDFCFIRENREKRKGGPGEGRGERQRV